MSWSYQLLARTKLLGLLCVPTLAEAQLGRTGGSASSVVASRTPPKRDLWFSLFPDKSQGLKLLSEGERILWWSGDGGGTIGWLCRIAFVVGLPKVLLLSPSLF